MNNRKNVRCWTFVNINLGKFCMRTACSAKVMAIKLLFIRWFFRVENWKNCLMHTPATCICI